MQRAFTRTDLTAVLVTISVLAAIIIAGFAEVRRSGRLDEDIANLHRLGVATSAYGADNQDLNWGFSWVGGETYLMMDINGDLVPTQMPADDVGAGARQAVHLIRMIGGRIGPNGLPIVSNWLPHVHYSHLALQEYLGTRIPDRAMVSTADSVRLDWQDDPENKFDEGLWLPLQPDPTPINRRWPYSSSFELTSSAWDRYQSEFDFDAQQNRVRQGSNHNTWIVPAQTSVGRISLADVAHPSGKVHLHDSHQRHFGDRMPYFGLAEARIPMLMFDGVASVRQSADSNPGWNPAVPTASCDVFLYGPSPWEPATTSGEFVDVAYGFYRWTRGGLKGLDFGGLPLDTGQANPGECDL